MNLNFSGFRAGWLVLVGGLLAAGLPVLATTNHPLAGERFLLVVETSSATQKRADNIQKVVGTMLASGLNENMYPGVTVGMWTFNEKLSAGKFPLQVWTPATRQRVALTAVQFLQPLKHEGPARLAVVWAGLTNLIAQSERLTIVLVTVGAEPVTGTPVDERIAETFKANADKQRAERMPFITVLRATRGEIVAAAVTTPPWSLEVPKYPDLPRDILQQIPPAAVLVAEEASTPLQPDPGLLAPTNVIYFSGEAEAVPESTPAVRPEVIAATGSAPETTSAPVAVPPAPVIENSGGAGASALRAPASPPPAQSSALVSLLLVGIVILLVIMAVFLALLASLRRRQAASLITHSLQRRE